MKIFSLLAIVLFLFTACTKPALSDFLPKPVYPALPAMDTINFNNREIAFGQTFSVDFNQDGINDFQTYTMLVGDASLQRDYRRFLIGTNQVTELPVNANEEVPALFEDHPVAHNSFDGYNWHNLTAIVLGQKVITNTGSWWEGHWLNVQRQYLPFRIYKSGKLHYGWIEISFSSTTEKLTLHRAAICKQAETMVFAGK